MLKVILIIAGVAVAGGVGFAVGRASASKFPFLPFRAVGG